MKRPATLLVLALAAAGAAGCARAPSPLSPQLEGSIGLPHRGVMTGAKELPRSAEGLTWLRQDDRHFGLPRFVAAIERAAGGVARERPGGSLSVGDLSRRTGGQLSGHASHRTGRDVDLLFYLTELDGTPVASPGFVHVEEDGLAYDPGKKRFYRFDVPRQWLLVKALVEDRKAYVQWIFIHRNAKALLVEWARARGEPTETIVRAMDMMLQPRPGGPHDDHVHVRTACLPEEIATGCEPSGPSWPWLPAAASVAPTTLTNQELVAELLGPVGDAPSLLASVP